MPAPRAEQHWQRVVEECFRREAGPKADLPDNDADLIATGVLDSMAWVGFLRAVESACNAPDLGSRMSSQPASFATILSALRGSANGIAEPRSWTLDRGNSAASHGALVVGSSAAAGSRIVPAEEVDRAYGMKVGKLRHRAGIESLAYAAEGENEPALGAKAAEEALRTASCGAQEIDWIIATSETHSSYPSLAAQLHSRLLARETCGALDVGGACIGLLNALAVAQSLIASGQARTIAVITADMHSRILTPGRVAGEFGGLFGDGASAFVLRGADKTASIAASFQLGDFFFGCAGQYAAAIQVRDAQDGGLSVQFDGEELSRAASTRMEKVLAEVELRSGISRASAGFFATHQPNARLVALLAKQLGVAPEAFPAVAKTSGNLGSSTCGAALHAALQASAKLPREQR